jgi:hypothetical protein
MKTNNNENFVNSIIENVVSFVFSKADYKKLDATLIKFSDKHFEIAGDLGYGFAFVIDLGENEGEEGFFRYSVTLVYNVSDIQLSIKVDQDDSDIVIHEFSNLNDEELEDYLLNYVVEDIFSSYKNEKSENVLVIIVKIVSEFLKRMF